MVQHVMKALGLLAALTSANAYWLMGIENFITTERLDPLVNPGKVSGHVHSVLGGSNFRMGNTTTASLRKSDCTSIPIPEDKSNYWFPHLYFQWANGSFSSLNGGSVIYYLFNDKPGTTKAFPDDFRMLSGTPTLRTYDPKSYAQQAVSFLCLDFNGVTTKHDRLPSGLCPSGIRAQINFPSCWDGKNLDSPDHKSHVAFLSGGPDSGTCSDPKYPVTLPRIFIEVYWASGDFDKFRSQAMNSTQPFVYSYGDPTGYGYHADFINGWDDGVLQKAVDGCNCAEFGDPQCCADKGIFHLTKGKQCRITKTIDEPTTGTLAKLPGNNPVQKEGVPATSFSDPNTPTLLSPIYAYTGNTPPMVGKPIPPASGGPQPTSSAQVTPSSSAASSVSSSATVPQSSSTRGTPSSSATSATQPPAGQPSPSNASSPSVSSATASPHPSGGSSAPHASSSAAPSPSNAPSSAPIPPASAKPTSSRITFSQVLPSTQASPTGSGPSITQAPPHDSSTTKGGSPATQAPPNSSSAPAPPAPSPSDSDDCDDDEGDDEGEDDEGEDDDGGAGEVTPTTIPHPSTTKAPSTPTPPAPTPAPSDEDEDLPFCDDDDEDDSSPSPNAPSPPPSSGSGSNSSPKPPSGSGSGSGSGPRPNGLAAEPVPATTLVIGGDQSPAPTGVPLSTDANVAPVCPGGKFRHKRLREKRALHDARALHASRHFMRSHAHARAF